MKNILPIMLLIATLNPSMLFAAKPSNAGLDVRVTHLEDAVSTLQEQVSDLILRLDNSDLDHDGFSVVAGDCDDADATIYPGAVDIPDDGVDNDCDGIIDNTTSGTQVGQLSPDFSLFDTLGISHSLYDELSQSSGVVLYFTMWSPINDSHMSHMRSLIIPNFPDVKFFIVDFVSGTIELARAAQVSNGFEDLTVLVDNIQEVLTLYQANMGTTVVIDNTGIVYMKEDYQDGAKLTEVLTTLK